MELRTLHYFTVVAQELNITRAAEKLNMSQPPLSNQIKALEEELGVQLFIRGKRHLELTEEGGLLLRRAVQIQELICSFAMDAKIVRRKKSYVVYLKEGSQIVDILNVMEAHVSLMELENVRILKEMRNTVNRKVNCETANINKTVSAAVRQMENITYLRDTIGFEKLPEGLEEVALARLSPPMTPWQWMISAFMKSSPD